MSYAFDLGSGLPRLVLGSLLTLIWELSLQQQYQDIEKRFC